MINKKNRVLTRYWLSGLLSAEIFISTGEWGAPDATTDQAKKHISVVRVSEGFPGNGFKYFKLHNFNHVVNDWFISYINGLVQDCGISIANTL